MTYDDVPAVEQLTATAFHQLSVVTRPANWPAPERRSAERGERWKTRLRHFVQHDAPGCWVAEDDGELVGCAVALLRDGLWGLSSFAVAPHVQSKGFGKALLEAALGHGPWSAGIICASHDPKAVRRYRLAGFDLHPAMLAWGHVPRACLPSLPEVRDGTADDGELLDSIDRAARGFGRPLDHLLILDQMRLVVTEAGASRGYAYFTDSGAPYLLAATDTAAAQRTLWGALAHSRPDRPVDFSNITAHQTWAVDVALSARLEIHTYGYVAVRGMPVPAPYIPSGHFL